jgi:crotonobetainyl-CoA:carnitine CoA-transferase CaiB-like acyl-CoA transferase
MRPLEDMKILDFTHGVAGSFATMILGDLGGDVIKIERPGYGDPTRYTNVSERFVADIPASGGDYFLAINRNKRAITLNLQSEDGQEIARDLVKWADIVVQNFRPGVMARLNLDYEAIRQLNPSVIYGNLSAYGQKGPLAHQPGMDVAVQARSGVMMITGYPGSGPIKPGVSLSDFSGGVHLAVALLAAIVHRERTGEGQEVHMSLLDATMIMLSNYSVAVIDGDAEIAPMGTGHPQLVPFQAFPSSDGFIVIATGTNRLFRELLGVLGLEEFLTDPRFRGMLDRIANRDALIEIISEATRRKTTDEWLTVMESNEIPCAPVQSLREAFTDPQLIANDMIVEIDHPTHGKIHVLGVPYKFATSECSIERTPPLLGEHNREVLQSILGLADERLEELREAGVISGAWGSGGIARPRTRVRPRQNPPTPVT